MNSCMFLYIEQRAYRGNGTHFEKTVVVRAGGGLMGSGGCKVQIERFRTYSEVRGQVTQPGCCNNTGCE